MPIHTARFTPAPAGNMFLYNRCWPLMRVHPRIRGEYGQFVLYEGSTWGSPPHPRGILRYSQGERSMARFTPASAGNMINVDIPVSSTQVHPRIRGEYSNALLAKSVSPGSPPHPRGILRTVGRYGRRIGFPPASAGNIEN